MACQPDIRLWVHVGDVAVDFKGKIVVAVRPTQFISQTGLIAQECVHPTVAYGAKYRALRGTAAAEEQIVIQPITNSGIVTKRCEESAPTK
jgi:hypothetical protein